MRLVPRIYSDPPPAQSKIDTNPTLLVSWWATGFSLAIIFVRLCGRYIRTERLFSEDWIMALSIVPLLIRMGFVHIVLIWGTNNAITDGFSEDEIRRREIGSRMVLGARIFYALFIWTAKFTIAEFLTRFTAQIWRRSFEYVLQFIRYFLIVTFIAVLITTLTECQPFTHYWQVVPDPGPKCRQGYAQLIAMGTCDVITDLLLVGFPIPIILLSAMPTKRKISLTLLFALSIILVAITCYRVPSVISRGGSQQYRSLIASLEILAAAAVSNAIVIGSFVRDRGLKKQKFKIGSLSESVEQPGSRRATISHHHWGSDADLVGDLGIRLDPDLHSPSYQKIRPAPPALPGRRGSVDPNWQFSFSQQSTADDDRTSTTDSLGGMKVNPYEYIETNVHPSNRETRPANARSKSRPVPKLSLNDVGGLLDPPTNNHNNHSSHNNIRPPPASHQHNHYSPPSPLSDPQEHRPRSRTLLRAVTGLLTSPTSGDSSDGISPRQSVQSPPNFSRPNAGGNYITAVGRPQHGRGNSNLSNSQGNQRRQPGDVPELLDLGGLLERDLENNIHR
ncbi:hypothetical protein FQN57_006505 [Myotisia sp. PD_48]|nr:hypothetical protein FQN57_006505 [Myotisia sp. PD_48]